ncbi:hypothetical protein E2C01_063065 [Portunus trituberculatus]|uniref:Uncharacterized protein n=1 Tax=Portunus trituberculatus TaxID=210409 RepID=A0A5B7HH43_PORTR|nr:hypothetical protein [Portunus trituberculatus]
MMNRQERNNNLMQGKMKRRPRLCQMKKYLVKKKQIVNLAIMGKYSVSL